MKKKFFLLMKKIGKMAGFIKVKNQCLNEAQKESLLTKNVLNLMETFQKNKVELRIVGGAVRDALLGMTIKDIDFAAAINVEKLEEICVKEKIKCIRTGFSHGTITAIINNEHFEITSLRKDESCDGRHAKVSFSATFQEDSCRRDFTVNALYVDKNANIYDYHNGLEDIKQRKVRFVGNPQKRVQEDYLRALRFFRFCGYLQNLKDNADSNVDTESLQAACHGVQNIHLISKERVRSELERIYSLNNSAQTLEFMHKNNCLLKLFALNENSTSAIEKNIFPNFERFSFVVNALKNCHCFSEAFLKKYNFVIQTISLISFHMQDHLTLESSMKQVCEGLKMTNDQMSFANYLVKFKLNFAHENTVAKLFKTFVGKKSSSKDLQKSFVQNVSFKEFKFMKKVGQDAYFAICIIHFWQNFSHSSSSGGPAHKSAQAAQAPQTNAKVNVQTEQLQDALQSLPLQNLHTIIKITNEVIEKSNSFPINGTDIKDSGIAGFKVGETLFNLERIWYDNALELTKKNLMKFV